MMALRRRMMEDMQVRSLSPQTQATYVQQVSLFARYFNRSPELLGPEEICSYQTYLTNERKLAASSISVAISALRFLYRITLHKDWSLTEVIRTPKKPQKLPIVPTTKTLYIVFKDGSIYAYQGVPEGAYQALITAQSAGAGCARCGNGAASTPEKPIIHSRRLNKWAGHAGTVGTERI